MMFSLGLCLVFMTGGMLCLCQRRKQPAALFAAVEDDDIKIAGGPHKAPAAQDTAELAAREFLRQKSNGNINQARRLGERFAGELWELAQSLIMDDASGLTQQEIHHRLLLCSYSANRVIAEFSPNSIVAQTALSRFYAEAEERSEVLYRHISDTAAFSLYILSERSGDNPAEIGKIYAKLSGNEGDAGKTRQGNEVYQGFYQRCKGIIEQVEYAG
jgi:hypothetical protein